MIGRIRSAVARVSRWRWQALVAAGMLALLWVGLRTLPGGRTPDHAGSCTLDVAVAVPALEALPVTSLGEVGTHGGRVCRLRIQGPARLADDPLAIQPGTVLLKPPGTFDRVAFLLVAQRSDAVLVSREPVGPHFLWHDLGGKVVILSRHTGDLGPVLVRAMVQHHALDQSPLLLDGLGERAFRDGNGAYLETTLATGMRLSAAKDGHLAVNLGIQAGPIPAAVLTSAPELVREHPRLLDSIARAVYENALRLTDRPAGTESSDTLDARVRREAARMRLWATDPRLDPSLFVRLGALMNTAGLTVSPPAPGTILPGPAEYALRKALPDSADTPPVRHE